ncbi:uncharacterized protein LOC127000493 [Eriocheir sinensis]|uniref:uncharacterized protein LOC127000493 n=1 Tax=Eriocheir sinensis TaxID=95602 RepID=UPI0021CAB5FE|nr:uncharacterized protein LOC127000493 [Eriocheir sinensis]
MQTSVRISTLLLFLLPHLLLLAPAAEAHRAVKSGCLNYGHSCLGAHGKRGSWPPAAPLPPAARLAPFLPALAEPGPAALSWQDKLAMQQQQLQHRRHHHSEDDEEQEPEPEDATHQDAKQHQHQYQPYPARPFPALYDDSALSPRVPLALPLARPAPLLQAQGEDDLLSYAAYDYDYGERRAKRSVGERKEGKRYPSHVSVSCLLFSRQC